MASVRREGSLSRAWGGGGGRWGDPASISDRMPPRLLNPVGRARGMTNAPGRPALMGVVERAEAAAASPRSKGAQPGVGCDTRCGSEAVLLAGVPSTLLKAGLLSQLMRLPSTFCNDNDGGGIEPPMVGDRSCWPR